MGAPGIAGADPVGNCVAGMVDAAEKGLVQPPVAHPTLERQAIPVSHTGSPRDEGVSRHPHRLGPGQHGLQGEACCVVADDQIGFAVPLDPDRLRPDNPPARKRVIGHGREKLAGHIGDQAHRTIAPPGGERVLDDEGSPAGACRCLCHL